MTGSIRALAAALLAATALGGCADAASRTMAGMGLLGGAEDFERPLSVADDGFALSATGPDALNLSMRRMLAPLKGRERRDVATAIVGLARYEGCLAHGEFEATDTSQGGLDAALWRGVAAAGRKTPAQCADPDALLGTARRGASRFLSTGAPNQADVGDGSRETAGTIARVAIGDFTPRRYARPGSRNGMQVFHATGGSALDGLTRTEVMRRFALLLRGQGPRAPR